MNGKLLIHAWYIVKKDNSYFLPYSHWIYLKHISNYYDEIILLSPCGEYEESSSLLNIALMDNVKVYELPSKCKSYISSVKHIFSYIIAYYRIKDIDVYYSRYPTPFGWLQKVFGKSKKRIVHFVGDPIDAAKNNPNFSFWKKAILVKGFFLENFLYEWACKGANVFTNGHHLAEKLKRKSVEAKPLISSTLTEKDFFYNDKVTNLNSAKFVYLGYLRSAKGIETILMAFSLYNQIYPNSTFKIIGAGESENKLKAMVQNNNICNVIFTGHIDDRDKINNELRESDIFLFGSLSEGSPRVILEAMANGLAVVSTPVGSLPAIFTESENILFADFNKPNDFLKKMLLLTKSQEKFDGIRLAGFVEAKKHTINMFIKSIFND